MSYAKLKYAWKSYGFCSEHGIGACPCIQQPLSREFVDRSVRSITRVWLIEIAMRSEWWNDPLTWVVE